MTDSLPLPQYVMSFTVVFPHEGDTCYLAHCYPYRYSDMMLDLANIRADPVRSDIFCNITNIFGDLFI